MASNYHPCPHHHLHHRDQVVVVVVPLPAQGHLNQLLQLSTLITAYNIPVHYLTSSHHLRQAKLRLNSWVNSTTTTIRFHDFNIPPLSNTLLHHHRRDTRFPAQLQPVFESSSQLRHPVTHLLQTLSIRYNRVIVVHDSLMSSVVQDVYHIPNAESYSFHSVSALALFYYVWEVIGKPDELLNEKINEIDIPGNEGCFTKEFREFMVEQYRFLSQSSGRIYNTSRVIEGKYMDLLKELPLNVEKRLFAIGPLNPVTAGTGGTVTGRRRRDKCLEWLDKQVKDSVMYVSFGTTTSMTSEEVKEIAIGLEESGQKFLWVLREADGVRGHGEDQLPKGYEETVVGRGIVVRDWVPQLEVLGHVATGGFMSHCGWNSCMESISMGVPIAAWPMHSDQPKNAVLVTEVLKVGLVVREWGRRRKAVTASVVESAVRRLMESEEGGEMRKRAKEVGCKVRDSVGDGGVSRLEMDSFVAHIRRR